MPLNTRCLPLLSWLSQLSSIASYTWMDLVCVIPETQPSPQRLLRENFPAGLVLLAGSLLIIPLHHKTQWKDLCWLVKSSSTRLIWPLISMLANEHVKPLSHETRGIHFTLVTWSWFKVSLPDLLCSGYPCRARSVPMTPSCPLCWADDFSVSTHCSCQCWGGTA